VAVSGEVCGRWFLRPPPSHRWRLMAFVGLLGGAACRVFGGGSIHQRLWTGRPDGSLVGGGGTWCAIALEINDRLGGELSCGAQRWTSFDSGMGLYGGSGVDLLDGGCDMCCGPALKISLVGCGEA
jgi:hypothetical protein